MLDRNTFLFIIRQASQKIKGFLQRIGRNLFLNNEWTFSVSKLFGKIQQKRRLFFRRNVFLYRTQLVLLSRLHTAAVQRVLLSWLLWSASADDMHKCQSLFSAKSLPVLSCTFSALRCPCNQWHLLCLRRTCRPFFSVFFRPFLVLFPWSNPPNCISQVSFLFSAILIRTVLLHRWGFLQNRSGRPIGSEQNCSAAAKPELLLAAVELPAVQMAATGTAADTDSRSDWMVQYSFHLPVQQL